MKAYILQLIEQSLLQISPDEGAEVFATAVLEVSPPKSEFGDYATNAAMVLFKKFNTSPAANPQELASLMAEKMQVLDEQQTFSKIENLGGFINFTLSEKYLHKILGDIHSAGSNFGTSDMGAGQKVLLEYFQPNMAKPLHLGHLRTAIIGDSLFKVLQTTGYKVESDTHLGDWGTQFGLLILAYKKWGDLKVIETDPINELNKLYVRINAEIEDQPELREQGKQEFVKLEQGDPENQKLWQQFRDWSWQEYSVIYDDLGVRKSDHDWPESFFAGKMPAVLEQLKEKGLLIDSQGAQIVNLEDYNLGIAVVVKSDGGTTYLLRDLATYIYRKEQGFEKQIYVVDNRQSHALNQAFKILELMGVIQSPDEAVHVAYGFLSLPEGAMSTRKGTVIGANELIERAQEKAEQIIVEKNPELSDRAEVAKQIMQSAIKYFDLSHNYKSDIIFTWDKALSFEGNTGPYLQYTHARICGILRKVKQSKEVSEYHFTESDIRLLRKLNQFSDSIAEASQNFTPNLICNFLFELSQEFNSFYENSPVMQEEDEQIKQSRIALISATAIVLKNGLSLLGIEAPERM